jgi:hypothetical protein
MTETNNATTNMETNQNPTPAAPAIEVAAPVAVETPAAPVAVETPATPAPAAVETPAPAKKADTLKIPAGSFTHTDLARLNGKTNQQVWTRYQAMVKSGLIIRDGERKPAGGKGKPSLLWKVNPNPPANVTVPTIAPSAPVTQPADGNVVLPTEAQIEAAQAPLEPTVEAAAPAAPEPPKDEPPTAGGTPEGVDTAEVGTAAVTVEVARVEVTPTPANLPVIEPVAGIAEPVVTPTIPAETPIEETCPACQHNLVARTDATGVMVSCNQPIAICPTSERVEGHGTSIKAAIATVHDKWDKLVAAMKQPMAAH